MNLITFSLQTKGVPNFARRLWTVFTRFGITEARIRRALYVVIDTLRENNGAPTFFIPAVVLGRHPRMIAEIVRSGAEVGIHGYVHNDYRLLSKTAQYRQTEQAISLFRKTQNPYEGFRNPYLGWTEESVQVFTELCFTYDSNQAAFHDVIDLDRLPPHLRSGYEKSLVLFQAIPCNAYTLRPHFEGTLLRIPTSIPDDEMLFDRLRISNAEEVGHIWSKVVERVYALGGIYTLNLHPERAILCKRALDILLSCARNQPLPVWFARLMDIAQWWKERSQFRLQITPEGSNRWRVEASCTSRATLLARHLLTEDQRTHPWFGADFCVPSHFFAVSAAQCPCIGLSSRTPQHVLDFLFEQGYPAVPCSEEEAHIYALYLDIPEGLGATRAEQLERRSALVQRIEALEAPFLHFGCWPDGKRMAVAISGDIDSVTVQDFFLRILEVKRHA
ncbi:MAG TPA: polysaccharide deacetylase family protein [Ktedonobacteraceae bacterium]|nr:polysaccharide deacetylase family protein [Ktedonobacteraceae bacterium]